ncbi:MAG: peptide chain release factor N(5)-glutamine methyltransferase [Rubrivivax sp.]|nr:peptide chain release factor N(5)-glutamine methyltransferase [Rubrivivax sp.]
MNTTVQAALLAARAQGLDRLDAQLLLAHVLQRPRAWLLAHDDEALTPDHIAQYRALCTRRADAEPLAYLTGEREFHGLPLVVGPGVLVPRPETEHLVDWALERLAGLHQPTVADLGTGSGAIALALARACPQAAVTAVERSPLALAIAQANGARLGLAVQWLAGDWWQPLAGQRFDTVVSNPPYIAAADPHLPALRHEPLAALAAGPDGLDDLRAIIAGASAHLQPGGWLLLEHGHDQGAAVRALLEHQGLAHPQTRRDLAGLERCSGACRLP